MGMPAVSARGRPPSSTTWRVHAAAPYRPGMTRIRLHAPTLQRDVDVDAADDLIEAEGMTWVRDGDVDGLPRYVPVAAG